MTTFEDFQKARALVDNISKRVGCDDPNSEAGFVYFDSYFICFNADRPLNYHLTIGRHEYLSDDLQGLELLLWSLIADDEMNS